MKNETDFEKRNNYGHVDLSGFYKYRINNFVKCDEPLISIASVMRSGGNLLNRLFDSHSHLRTYHSELLFGVMSDFTSKNKKLKSARFPFYEHFNDVEAIFDELSTNDPFIGKAMYNGWVKVNYEKPLPFFYDRSFHKEIFIKLCTKGNLNQRKILDNYVTGFFNSYIDCQGIYSSDKQYVTTYWPGFVLIESNVERFLSVYPDGKLISIIRNPLQWAGSTKKRASERASDPFNFDYMDKLWLDSVKKSVLFKKKYPNKFILIDFKNLVVNTERMMIELCGALGLPFENSMTSPTINSIPVEANSINKENQLVGIVHAVLNSYKYILNEEEIVEINDRYSGIYNDSDSMMLSL